MADEEKTNDNKELKKDAEIVHTHSMTYKNQLEFLTGDVANAFLGGNVTAPINSGKLIEDVRRALKSVRSCPDGGLQPHSCVPATCTLATSCLTKSPGSGCTVV